MSSMDAPDIQQIREGFSEEFIESHTPINISLLLGLRKIGVLKPSEQFLSYKDLFPWKRGGAETFFAVSSLKTTGGISRKFVAKAFVSLGSTPAIRAADMQQRRQQLSRYGIRVPQLYGQSPGIIYEEWIAHNLKDVRDKLTPQGKKEVAETAAILDHLGFSPFNFLNDMRCSADYNEAYYVDFGSDLGGISAEKNNVAFKQLKSQFKGDDLLEMEKIYSMKRGEL